MRHLVRIVERQVARQFQVQGDLDTVVELEHRQVVHLAHARHRRRGGPHALAQYALFLAGLDVDDRVGPGEDPLERLLHTVGDRVTLPDGGVR